MKLVTKISLLALVSLLASCQELPSYFVSDTVLARAGTGSLGMRDVAGVVPAGVTGDDSVAFMNIYVDRWVRKQIKLQEAEVRFSSAEEDIDKMVEEYRQALLIRKLEQQYVDQRVDTLITDEQMASYYQDHRADFKLDRTLVKGIIVRVDDNSRQGRKLKDLIGSKSEADQRDFRDICEKNNFKIVDFRSSWVDFTEFLVELPTLRSQSYDAILKDESAQKMSDRRSDYYFKIEAVCGEGDNIPFEMLRATIRRIIFNQRQGEVIRAYEQELYDRAVAEDQVKLYENK